MIPIEECFFSSGTGSFYLLISGGKEEDENPFLGSVFQVPLAQDNPSIKMVYFEVPILPLFGVIHNNLTAIEILCARPVQPSLLTNP